MTAKDALSACFVKGGSRYVPALDGLRAFAVLAVIAYHMKADWAPGGLLGVTMFFVLSGYLITGLLQKEFATSGTISLKNFWLRRVRRIIPAVVFAVLGTGLLCTLFDHALLTKMRPDVLPTLFFVNNWWQIFHNVSYFAALGEPSPLTHYWSLAIEEQFYLIWPVALLTCMKAGIRKDVLTKGTIVLAAISALDMLILFDPSQDPSRVYYGTDTRAFSLLIGSALALVWPYQSLQARHGDRLTPRGKLVLNLVGVAALAGLIVMVATTNGFSPFIYRGGLLLCSVLTALAIAVMVHPASWIGAFFRLRPLVWVGKCSYSMYLWHYPLILIITPNNIVGDAPLWLRAIQLAVIFAVSAFSYYVVEDPIRKGAIGKWVAQVRSGKISVSSWVGTHMVPVIVAAVFVIVPLGGFAFVPEVNSVGNTAVMNSGGSNGSHPSSSSSSSSQQDQRQNQPQDQASVAAEEEESGGYDILLLGDSVPAALEGYGVFYEVFPNGHIDAVVGRYFGEAIPLYQQYKDAGEAGNVIVVALGTNGYIPDEETEAFMAEVGPKKHVWLVNTRSQTDFVDVSNAAIQRCADKYPNVELIDWYTKSAELGEFVFDGDGTHLTIDGCWEYINMIKSAVEPYLPSHDPEEEAREQERKQQEEEQAALDAQVNGLKGQVKQMLSIR